MSKILLDKLNVLLTSGELENIVVNSFSASGVVRKLGYSENGKRIKYVREYLISNGISICHWTTNGMKPVSHIQRICPVCNEMFSGIPSEIKDQVTCSVGCANTYFRSGKDNPNYKNGKGSYRNFALANLDAKCVICGYSHIEALEVHHLDKDRSNNNITNLEILCANCHVLKHKGLLEVANIDNFCIES